jgi:hypothetical protein
MPGLAQTMLNDGRIETARRWCDWLERYGLDDVSLTVASVGALIFAQLGDVERTGPLGRPGRATATAGDADAAASGLRLTLRAPLPSRSLPCGTTPGRS